jgi:hypothetical protein
MAPFGGCSDNTHRGTSRCREREPSTPSMAPRWTMPEHVRGRRPEMTAYAVHRAWHRHTRRGSVLRPRVPCRTDGTLSSGQVARARDEVGKTVPSDPADARAYIDAAGPFRRMPAPSTRRSLAPARGGAERPREFGITRAASVPCMSRGFAVTGRCPGRRWPVQCPQARSDAVLGPLRLIESAARMRQRAPRVSPSARPPMSRPCFCD